MSDTDHGPIPAAIARTIMRKDAMIAKVLWDPIEETVCFELLRTDFGMPPMLVEGLRYSHDRVITSYCILFADVMRDLAKGVTHG